MNIRFQLNMEDIFALQDNVVDTSYAHKIKQRYFRWILFIMILLASIWLWKMNTWIGYLLAIVAIVFLFVAAGIYQYLMKRSLKKRISKIDHSKLLQPCEMTFAEDGIHRDLSVEVNRFDWKQFNRCTEDSARYFFYVDDLQGLIIPKTPSKVETLDVESYQMQMETYMKEINES